MIHTCSHCEKNPRVIGQRWCQACRTAYMREWRRSRGGYRALSTEQKKRSSVRSYANVYQKRGKLLLPERCQRCGDENHKIEKHHPDYDAPLFVVRLCRPCHVALTKTPVEGDVS